MKSLNILESLGVKAKSKLQNLKMNYMFLTALLLGGVALEADAQCCGVNYSMISVGVGSGSMITNVFSPNNGRTKDLKGLVLGRQGQAGIRRMQTGAELRKGGQVAEDGSRSYTGYFPKAFVGGGIGFPDESLVLPYIFGNVGLGASLITGGQNNGEPIKTPQLWGFVEGGGGVEVHVAPELLKLFIEMKYTKALSDNVEGIHLNDGRTDAQVTGTVGVRWIIGG